MFTSFDGGWLCDSGFKGLPEVFATLPLRCPNLLVFWPIHHFQHAHAASSDEADHQDCRQHQKDDIEHSGIVPTEQTKLTMATSGPTSGPSILAQVGLLDRKKACQNDSGTQAARAPAMSRPRTISTQTEAQSITK
jgi:hypothetical protein